MTMTQGEFFDFCQIDRKIRYERNAQGELITNSWFGGTTAFQAVAISTSIHVWAKDVAGGIGFGSSVGYILPNGANRSPIASWVSPRQLSAISREQMKKFVPVCPCFVVE